MPISFPPGTFRRYLFQNSVQAAASLAEGPQAAPSTTQVLTDANKLLFKGQVLDTGLEPLYPIVPLNRAKSAVLAGFGVGAAGATNIWNIWAATGVVLPDGSNYAKGGTTPASVMLMLHLIGEVTFINGAKTGVANYPLVVADVMAKTCTFTIATTAGANGPGDDFVEAFGEGTVGLNGSSKGVYTPASTNGVALLPIPQLCRAGGLIFERTGGTATSGNLLVQVNDL